MQVTLAGNGVPVPHWVDSQLLEYEGGQLGVIAAGFSGVHVMHYSRLAMCC